MNARRLFQCAGIGAILVMGISGIVDTQAAQGHRERYDFFALMQFLLLLGFAFAFWYNTREMERRRSSVALGLMVLQLPLLMALPAELIYLVAAEIPFVLRGAKVFLGVAGLELYIVVFSLLSAYRYHFVVSESVSSTSPAVAVALTIAMMLTWSLVSFSLGYLTIQLEESHKAVVWAKAQLEGSQYLLGETIRVGERLRISRELHDSVGHHLAGLAINLELVAELSTEAVLPPLCRAQLIVKMILAETREMVHSMAEDQSLDLKSALDRLIAVIKRPTCHLEVGSDIVLGPVQARALFRCAQESMTNAVRHAHAANFWLKIMRQDGCIVFDVSDDGQGVTHVVPGYGLRGMKERLTELGGDLEIESAHLGGFHLHGWIPATDSKNDPHCGG